MKKRLTVVAMIGEFQCPGCVYGPDPKSCSQYKYEEHEHVGSACCATHCAGTRILGIGRVVLGLPRGFNRYGTSDDMPIRLYEKGHPKGVWNPFNVPVWKMMWEGFLLVRTYSPRVNRSYIDVIQGGNIDDPALKNAYDVGAFYNEID